MYENLLKYQDVDVQISNLAKSLKRNPKRILLEALAKKIKVNRDNLIELDALANKMLGEFTKLKEQYEQARDEIDKLNTGAKEMDLRELQASINKLNDFSVMLNTLNKALLSEGKNVEELLFKADEYKRNIITSLKAYKVCKVENEKLDEECDEKTKELISKMQDLESSVDPKMLAKYKELRQEMDPPIFVLYNNSEWCTCGMHIPSASISKLKQQGYLVCEQCHKYILYTSPKK